MKANDIPIVWLRARAKDLRRAAAEMEEAYSGKLVDACARVAKAYRRAAVLLDDEATTMEDELP